MEPRHDPVPDRRSAGSPAARAAEKAAERAYAWRRYRRLMRWMVLVSIAAVLLALGWLRASGGPLPVHMVIATAAGVGLSVLLGTALMGLVFMSAGTGHDDEVGTPDDDEETPR